MLLLIDIGNTKIKWALVESSQTEVAKWLKNGTLSHGEAEHLKDAISGKVLRRVLISNVAGKAIRDRLARVVMEAQGEHASVEWFASTSELAGIRNSYRNPAQLGCDRFAAMIGARALFPGKPLIVASCGTATTVDAVTAEGVFVGGMILPGLGLMASSLARGTAHLPQVAQHSLGLSPFAQNTSDAIMSGCIAAQTGAIEHAVALLVERSGAAQCVLSGGAAAALSAHLSAEHQIVDNLVLTGLHVVAMT